MMFFLGISTLVIATVAALLYPLFRKSESEPLATQHNLSVYRDQLHELERDYAAGTVTEEELAAARLEIERRVVGEQKRAQTNTAAPSQGRSELFIAVCVGLVPLLAGGIYFSFGRPTMPDMPYAQRTDLETATAAAEGAHPEMNGMIATLRERLLEEPDDLEGWALLARSLVNNGQFEQALPAYQQAIRLTQGRDAQIAAEYAETLVLASDGMVVPEAESVFQNLLAEDENDPQSLYYIGLADAQRGDNDSALRKWQQIVDTSPSEAPWVPTVKAQIINLKNDPATSPSLIPNPSANTTSGPTPEAIEAASQLSPEQQAQMIEGMVASLAAKLDQDRDNLDGWQRLARAYQVLNRPEAEKSALNEIIRLAPEDAAARERLTALGG